MRKLFKFIVPIIISMIWTAWTVILFISKEGYYAGSSDANANPFAVTGSFGDSFGPVASVMATIAAIAAYLAFTGEQESRSVQNFESNFFTLLSSFESTTNQLRMVRFEKRKKQLSKYNYKKLQTTINSDVSREFSGRSSLRIILYLIRNDITPPGYGNIKVVAQHYDEQFDRWVGQLGHYFRTLYHIMRLIDKCPHDKMYYARIIRAQLSNDELCLLAYNCVVGEGRYKFKDLAVRYSLFHNLHQPRSDEFALAEFNFFLRKIPREAFRFEENFPITFDD